MVRMAHPVPADYRGSATNMIHYWALRQSDLRDLQGRLAAFGLSSLGRSEPHVEATLRLVRAAVIAMLEDTWHPPAIRSNDGPQLLRRRAIELLGAGAGRTRHPGSWSPCRRRRRQTPPTWFSRW